MSNLKSAVSVEETSDPGFDVSRDGRGPFSKKGGKQWPRHALRFEIGCLQTSDLKKTQKDPEKKVGKQIGNGMAIIRGNSGPTPVARGWLRG